MQNLTKIILLTNNQIIISEIEEVTTELGEPDCKLINPYLIDQINMEMTPWMQNYSSPGVVNFMIHSDKILTLFDPRATLLEKYEELTK
jgi:hypothetical protein